MNIKRVTSNRNFTFEGKNYRVENLRDKIEKNKFNYYIRVLDGEIYRTVYNFCFEMPKFKTIADAQKYVFNNADFLNSI